MRKKAMAMTVAAFAVLGLILTPAANAAPNNGPDSVTPLHAPCGTGAPTNHVQRMDDAAITGVTNQRNGSSISCTAVGALQPTDDAYYYCYTDAEDGNTWTYLKNRRTGVKGWVRDDLLRNNGSLWHCGF
jgi:hypothetical protein